MPPDTEFFRYDVFKIPKLHQWPGNIRELQNVIVLAAYHATGDTISDTDITISESSPKTESSPLLNDPDVEKQTIQETLTKTDGNKSQAAKLLGIVRSTLYTKLKNHGFNIKIYFSYF